MSYWFSPSDLVTSCHPVCLPGGKDSRFPHFILRSSAAEQHHRESSHGSIWMMSLHVVCVSPSSLTGITHCMCVSMFDCHCRPSTGWNVNVLPSTHPQFTFLLTYSTFCPLILFEYVALFLPRSFQKADHRPCFQCRKSLGRCTAVFCVAHLCNIRKALATASVAVTVDFLNDVSGCCGVRTSRKFIVWKQSANLKLAHADKHRKTFRHLKTRNNDGVAFELTCNLLLVKVAFLFSCRELDWL